MIGTVPDDPPIFHITRVEHVASIVEHGLCCDARVRREGLGLIRIGHAHIKERRLARAVHVAAGGVLADYVPFHFCPRSVMLYVVWRGHDGYDGGEDRVIHLCSTVRTVVATGRPFAFSDRHPVLVHATLYDDLDRLDQVDWSVMPKKKWRHERELRDAELLVHGEVPWSAITRIGVKTPALAAEVAEALAAVEHRPDIQVRPLWYYGGPT